MNETFHQQPWRQKWKDENAFFIFFLLIEFQERKKQKEAEGKKSFSYFYIRHLKALAVDKKKNNLTHPVKYFFVYNCIQYIFDMKYASHMCSNTQHLWLSWYMMQSDLILKHCIIKFLSEKYVYTFQCSIRNERENMCENVFELKNKKLVNTFICTFIPFNSCSIEWWEVKAFKSDWVWEKFIVWKISFFLMPFNAECLSTWVLIVWKEFLWAILELSILFEVWKHSSAFGLILWFYILELMQLVFLVWVLVMYVF